MFITVKWRSIYVFKAICIRNSSLANVKLFDKRIRLFGKAFVEPSTRLERRLFLQSRFFPLRKKRHSNICFLSAYVMFTHRDYRKKPKPTSTTDCNWTWLLENADIVELHLYNIFFLWRAARRKRNYALIRLFSIICFFCLGNKPEQSLSLHSFRSSNFYRLLWWANTIFVSLMCFHSHMVRYRW